MKSSLLAAGAIVVLAAGVWIGRSTSHTSEAAPATTQAAPRAAVLPRSQPQAPTLTRPAPSRALLADLSDADPKIRRAAIREAVKAHHADTEMLLKAARDPDAGVGVIAIDELGHLHAQGVIAATELIALGGDRALNERVRLTAINAFGQVPTPESAAYLADRLAIGDTFERLNAAILIGHQDLEIAVPALIRALGDTEERVRGNALEMLRINARGRDFGVDQAAWQAWWTSLPR